MKPWLKKIDTMKAEAVAKANKATADSTRRAEEMRRIYTQNVQSGASHSEATQDAVRKSGASLGRAEIHLRGWFLCLSLSEVDFLREIEPKAEGVEPNHQLRCILSVTRSSRILGEVASTDDLREIVERLGGEFDKPYLTPERDGTVATYWRWDHKS